MDATTLELRLLCRRSVIALLLAIPFVLALLLLARRLAGALVEPLPVAGWLCAGFIVALWLRWFYSWLPASDSALSSARRALVWLAPALAILLALILWLPGTRGGALIGFAAIVAIGSARWGGLNRRPSRWSASRPTRPARSPDLRFTEEETPVDLLDDVEEPNGAMSPLDTAIIQQMIRRREPGHAESIVGSLRADFSAGQRIASAHVAICPPFELAPRCQAAVAAGPPAEVRVATALPFGVRLEIKLARPALEPASVVIELAIDSTDGEQAASDA